MNYRICQELFYFCCDNLKRMRFALLLFALPLAAQIHIEACSPTDAGYSLPSTCYTSPIVLPMGSPGYLQKERYGTFVYHFAVADGPYSAALHFVENSTAITAISQRVFSVSINGAPVIPSLDLFATAGFNVPVDKSFPSTASGGAGITIAFTTILRNAVISAIDITPVPVAPANPFPGCIPKGGGISCDGPGFFGQDGKYASGITFGGVTYLFPVLVGGIDSTNKFLKDSGPTSCANVDPSITATVCHQLVWATP